MLYNQHSLTANVISKFKEYRCSRICSRIIYDFMLGRAVELQIMREHRRRPGRGTPDSEKVLLYPDIHITGLSWVLTLHHNVGTILLVEIGLALVFVISHRYRNSVMERKLQPVRRTRTPARPACYTPVLCAKQLTLLLVGLALTNL